MDHDNRYLPEILYNFLIERMPKITLESLDLLKTFSGRLALIMLLKLPIIPSRISQIFNPLFLNYSNIITYYSPIILLIFVVSMIIIFTLHMVLY